MSKSIYTLVGELELLSALSIGTGESEMSDSDILLNSAGKPFIPATSFLGKLYTELPEKYPKFWGRTQNKGNPENQSNIKCSDLQLVSGNPVVSIRESIRIDPETGTCADKAKYNYQVVESGITFSFKVELHVLEFADHAVAKHLLNQIVSILHNGLRLGAKTSVGLGQVKLSKYNISHYDLDSKNGLLSKLLNKTVDYTEGIQLDEKKACFTIQADFHICSSVLIRSNNTSGFGPDTAHLFSGQQPIVSGSSLKGILRARAEKILNTLNSTKPEEVHNYLAGLFGDIERDDNGNPLPEAKTVPSRVLVSERVISNVASEQQTRIKIDKFTGGTVAGDLLEEVPVFQQSTNAEQVNLQIEINIIEAEPADKGLAVLLLKDLWTEDLSIGGERSIGRGYLKGISAKITIPGESTLVLVNPITISSNDEKQLNDYITLLADIDGQVNKKRLTKYGYKLKGSTL